MSRSLCRAPTVDSFRSRSPVVLSPSDVGSWVSATKKRLVYSIKELTSEPRTQIKILLFWLCSKGERSLKLVTAPSFSDLRDLRGSLSAVAFY